MSQKPGVFLINATLYLGFLLRLFYQDVCLNKIRETFKSLETCFWQMETLSFMATLDATKKIQHSKTTAKFKFQIRQTLNNTSQSVYSKKEPSYTLHLWAATTKVVCWQRVEKMSQHPKEQQQPLFSAKLHRDNGGICTPSALIIGHRMPGVLKQKRDPVSGLLLRSRKLLLPNYRTVILFFAKWQHPWCSNAFDLWVLMVQKLLVFVFWCYSQKPLNSSRIYKGIHSKSWLVIGCWLVGHINQKPCQVFWWSKQRMVARMTVPHTM